MGRSPNWIVGMDESINQELEHRRSLWNRLLREGGPERVEPGLLRELDIYGGAIS